MEDELLEMKTTIAEMNTLNEIDVRINSVEIKISDFEDNVNCPK